MILNLFELARFLLCISDVWYRNRVYSSLEFTRSVKLHCFFSIWPTLYPSFIFMSSFPLARVAGAAGLGNLEIHHGQQQS